MTKKEEYKGYWFLPETPDNRIPGILYFEPNQKIRLELIGGFETDLKEIFTKKSSEIILGITNKNEKISLLICNGYSSVNFPSEFHITNYNCRYFISGKHLSSISELAFDRLMVDLTALYDWYPSGLIKNTIKLAEKGTLGETVVSMNSDDSWEDTVEIDTDYVIKISGVGNFTTNPNWSKFDLTQNTILEISHKNSKQSFIELLNKVEIFKQFLSLATLTSISYIQLTLFDNCEFQELKDGEKIFKKIHFNFIEEKEEQRANDSIYYLFKHTDIKDEFHDIIKKWYEFKAEFAPIRNHLIDSIKYKRVFSSLDFLILVQALEGYHRRFIKKKIKVPKNESELKLRLNELINTFSGIDKISKTPINLKHVVSSRNYYSHFFDKNNFVLQGKELYFLSRRLRCLLICCVLNLVGLDISLINKLLNKNERI